MQVNDLAALDPNVDYTKILPIQQKRMTAFINHFVMNTVSFLNKFAQSCESRLMEFEYKLQHVEASLLILESQLASIPHLEDEEAVLNQITKSNFDIDSSALPVLPVVEQEELQTDKVETVKDITPTPDPLYQKFFKMVQVGVPVAAVKLKMQAEGLDPLILETLQSNKGN